MSFITYLQVKDWVAQSENRKHPNYAKVHDETILMLAYDSMLHKHPLKQYFERGMKEQNDIGRTMGMLFGKEMIEVAEQEALNVQYPIFLKKLKEGWHTLPDIVKKAIDVDREIVHCEVDLEIMDKIVASIQECNRLVFYEV